MTKIYLIILVSLKTNFQNLTNFKKGDHLLILKSLKIIYKILALDNRQPFNLHPLSSMCNKKERLHLKYFYLHHQTISLIISCLIPSQPYKRQIMLENHQQHNLILFYSSHTKLLKFLEIRSIYINYLLGFKQLLRNLLNNYQVVKAWLTRLQKLPNNLYHDLLFQKNQYFGRNQRFLQI